MGVATFKIAKSLAAPSKLERIMVEQILEWLKNQFNPKPSEIVQRFVLNKRDQRSGEGINTHTAELRTISATCNYGDRPEEMLRDRLVCSIRDPALQKDS